MTRRMPDQNPTTSEQVVETPPEFMAALARMGVVPDLDLAALPTNAKAPRYYTPDVDGLRSPWDGRCMWLNPEFGDIAQWLYRAACEAPIMALDGRALYVLVPASTDTKWFRDYVFQRCHVTFLQGRIKFVGHKQGFPKGLMLLGYGLTPGFSLWDWCKK